MHANARFWLFTALLTSVAGIALHLGLAERFLESYPNPNTQAASAGILAIFFFAYAVVGQRTSTGLYRAEQALRDLEIRFPDHASGKDKIASVLALLDQNRYADWSRNVPFLFDPAYSSVSEAIADLAVRVKTMREVGSSEPINRQMYQEDFEDRLSSQLDVLGKFRWSLFAVGFLGTIIGIVIALATQFAPETTEETKAFVFNIISGMGLAYVTSMFGLGSGLILYLLGGFLEGSAENISWRFRRKMFCVIFPVIHSAAFEQRWGERRHIDETPS